MGQSVLQIMLTRLFLKMKSVFWSEDILYKNACIARFDCVRLKIGFSDLSNWNHVVNCDYSDSFLNEKSENHSSVFYGEHLTVKLTRKFLNRTHLVGHSESGWSKFVFYCIVLDLIRAREQILIDWFWQMLWNQRNGIIGYRFSKIIWLSKHFWYWHWMALKWKVLTQFWN